MVRLGQDGRHLSILRWGLIPRWSKKAKPAAFINARSETVASKPAFRDAFANRRCLLLADGFYEWKKVGKGKQPWYFHLTGEEPFAFAGIWERWQPSEGDPVETCALLTTEPNDTLRPVHDRMPVILPAEARDAWLQGAGKNGAGLLAPYASPMEGWPVSEWANNARHQGQRCVEPPDG